MKRCGAEKRREGVVGNVCHGDRAKNRPTLVAHKRYYALRRVISSLGLGSILTCNYCRKNDEYILDRVYSELPFQKYVEKLKNAVDGFASKRLYPGPKIIFLSGPRIGKKYFYVIHNSLALYENK